MEGFLREEPPFEGVHSSTSPGQRCLFPSGCITGNAYNPVSAAFLHQNQKSSLCVCLLNEEKRMGVSSALTLSESANCHHCFALLRTKPCPSAQISSCDHAIIIESPLKGLSEKEANEVFSLEKPRWFIPPHFFILREKREKFPISVTIHGWSTRVLASVCPSQQGRCVDNNDLEHSAQQDQVTLPPLIWYASPNPRARDNMSYFGSSVPYLT